MKEINFLSDTATLPSPEMRQAIFDADMGDDVAGEDPSANRLEDMAANILGKEAALVVSSGTMGNLVASLSHCERGDEMIVGQLSHINRGEGGGPSVIGGISIKALEENASGLLDPDQVKSSIHPDNFHYPKTAMIAIENTHNATGGIPLTREDTKVLADVAHQYDLPIHVDGARLFDAAVALETPAVELVKDVDTVTFCLSKSLGAPVGSVLCGSNEFVNKARRWRKVLGGGMRQVGVFAAAGIYALENNINRLAEDHSNARRLAKGLSGISGISIDLDKVRTNLVFFEITKGSPSEISRRLSEKGVRGGSPETRWRFVPHYGINSDDIDRALDVIESVLREY
ncbi:MAG: GntG family PLP-dependent aldolase [Chloroflexota bacterium]|nr:GntG family PLP-dependent aldolase [Chloroflexota bacterium]